MKHLGTKTIETERLTLRRFAVEDAEKMYENWAGDPEVTRFLLWPTHTDAGVTRALLETWVADYEQENKYEWCISLKETKEPIGSIGAFGGNEKANSLEIGYCIGRAYWHKGYTSEAVAAVMKFLLEEVGCSRIEARHDPKNPHSGGVMKKCGLRYEGTRIQADWNNSGICDEALYGYVKGVTDAAPAPAPAETGRPNSGISDEMIEYVGILAKLELNAAEREQAKKDMSEMLDYIDRLNELDTDGVEPASHIFPVTNVFREDVVTNGDGSAESLLNAPEKKDGGFKVPKTIG